MAQSPGQPLPKGALVAVVGAGAMGAGIAQVATQAGHAVRIHDLRQGAARTAVSTIGQRIADLATKGRLAPEAARDAAARLAACDSLADCAGAALVVEAIAEDLGAKRALLKDLDAIIADGAVFATNTSSLSITAIAAGSRNPGRVAGMHFFNPAPVLPLVEIVSGLATDPAVAGLLYATAAAWGKSPVHARSTPGFIVNRCARPFYGEALRLLTERAADVATLDAVFRDCGGFRMGPFELMDLIGLDVNYAVTQSVWEATYRDPRYAPSFAQKERVDAGLLGRKSGRGFHDHAADAKPAAAAQEAPAPRPSRLRVHGEAGLLAPLCARIEAAGVVVSRAEALAGFDDGVLEADGTLIALTDGRTATARARASGLPALLTLDLALDYAGAARLAVAAADSCPAEAISRGTGLLQAAGATVTRLDDVAGLAVMRTVAMLANEAAEAAKEGIAEPAAIDLAMQKGVNYPRGPLAWGEAIGLRRVRAVVANLAAHYGEDRYRVSPWIARRADMQEMLDERA